MTPTAGWNREPLWLEEPEIARHVVIDPSTSAGLAKLAAAEGAQLILFGSDYRTPPGRVEPGGSAQGLLEGSPVAIGVAAAGLRTRAPETIQTISVAGSSNGAAHHTAAALAQALGAQLLEDGSNADLIVVDSQSNGPEGKIALGGSTRAQLDSARGSVIVLPRGAAVVLERGACRGLGDHRAAASSPRRFPAAERDRVYPYVQEPRTIAGLHGHGCGRPRSRKTPG